MDWIWRSEASARRWRLRPALTGTGELVTAADLFQPASEQLVVLEGAEAPGEMMVFVVHSPSSGKGQSSGTAGVEESLDLPSSSSVSPICTARWSFDRITVRIMANAIWSRPHGGFALSVHSCSGRQDEIVLVRTRFVRLADEWRCTWMDARRRSGAGIRLESRTCSSLRRSMPAWGH
jgi:hypothetical protein